MAVTYSLLSHSEPITVPRQVKHRQYRAANRLHRDRARRQSGQPDRSFGQDAKPADRRQCRFRAGLWPAAASARLS
jgi:hypothetical protein